VEVSRNCPKCKVEMLPGKVRTYGANEASVAKGIWGGLKVKAYVCSGCGYVELYVDKPEEVEKKLGKRDDGLSCHKKLGLIQ
jgi:predicted nucleic-acid-binding Zn-ribbon protein